MSLSCTAPAAAEKRQSGRLVVMRPGVVVSAGRRRRRCLIVDLGLGGARLQLLCRGLPREKLTLIDRSMNAVHELRVVWSRGPLVGVAFTASAEAA